MMAHAFKSLHFNVTLHKWLNLVETVSTLRKVFQRSPDRSGDGFVCCIISRAIDNRLQATDMNCEGLRPEDVRRFFNGDACPALVAKPKLFFVQSYTVSEFQPCAVENRWDDGWETDGGARQLRPDCLLSDADRLWSHCSTAEHQLQRGRHRSVYLKALTDALGRSQGRKNLVTACSFGRVLGAVGWNSSPPSLCRTLPGQYKIKELIKRHHWPAWIASRTRTLSKWCSWSVTGWNR
ncbi:CASP8 and FADD-like apoptosis regulator isoform X3 [Syngnathoides biaculeatus]|uniref:CASP8 and FADD-like apoptosis regulator isoform X3 n=1 Tax=Syngnathoides biaculeatus TaxID=300417 RepID=UPI002ADDB96B|nr:CASP8 and FADD-like apoptosis regulator isoform X3 [Syngnathoides biaculeatus]